MERKCRRNVSSPGRCGAVAKFVRICPKHPIVDGQTIRITLVDGFMVATYWVEQFVTNEDQRKAFFVVYALRWGSTSIVGLLPIRKFRHLSKDIRHHRHVKKIKAPIEP